ncbi:hydroxyisourate hydrolase [Shouchella patagoniensis]|uniref:hydroxyisourate hydrolase n=1 Tax=Shouchella patagoniensis TaxID=228576 RepID=UPI0009950C75|nr:hydroxyisourate hydrolase [Shouchella patagoniensis]
MSEITTHILDLVEGIPAASVRIKLFHIKEEERYFLNEEQTNQDGRLNQPLIEVAKPGTYELIFGVGDYFNRQSKRTFFTDVPIRFEVLAGEEHYHVPLLISPWGYQIYRGS